MSGRGTLDRRTTIKWVLAASTALPMLRAGAFAAGAKVGAPAGGVTAPAPAYPGGYGTDPDLVKVYRPGDVWPLTLDAAQRATATSLCDLIIPADAQSPAASAVGVVDFIDEWVSAPYPEQRADRTTLLAGLAWIEAEAQRRFQSAFPALDGARQRAICDEICYLPMAAPERQEAARFFARFRDLTAGGYYSTPEGTSDLGFVGNVALERFDGPPLAVLQQVGLL